MKDSKFDDIRPYSEEEIPAAMQRIAESEVFPLLASFVYPADPIEETRRRIRSFTSVRQFQHDTMRRATEQIIARSISAFTAEGLERLSPEGHYLFVANHRDIMLDASLLQYHLVMNGFDTTEITFGANLMTHPVIVDVGRSNKMFRVARPGGDSRAFYRQSMHLSEYIRHTIREKGQSVWIAQRNGRTKNGIDQTDQGIVKMFGMSDAEDRVRALDELNMVPVAVAYEWEPCDVLKALEVYESQHARYTKKPGEDINSILTGILQSKGRVHMAICEPIRRAELEALAPLPDNEYHKSVARLIDSRIHGAYRLYPNNYMAHDLLHGDSRYRAMYTEKERDMFVHRLQTLDRYEDTCDMHRLREIFLGIYAHPVGKM